ncbi:MAG: YigZ family protein [Candidatus Zixiibacteriota bacterium]
MSSNPSDEYLTIKSLVRDKIKIESSIFIATAVPVDSEESAKEWIQKISREFHDATHNCYAWRVKNHKKEIEKYSDAGEPRGTAGKPIISAIEAEELHNVLVVVTRYYGGIKLGTGGLSRAYRSSAYGAVQKAEKITEWITSDIKLSYPVNMTGKVQLILSKHGVRTLDSFFDELVELKIQIRDSWSDRLKKALIEATNGQVKFK